MEYDVMIIAFPTNSALEGKLYNTLMFYNNPSEIIYASHIEGIETDDIKQELEHCMKYGFSKEEDLND